MPRKLCDLKDTFFIEGRGAILVLPKDDQWQLSPDEKIHRFERILIVTPSGSEIRTFIKDLDFSVRNGPRDSNLCFTLPSDIKRGMIPTGSEIWLERDGAEPVFWEDAPKQ